jgi:hypothetical protein
MVAIHGESTSATHARLNEGPGRADAQIISDVSAGHNADVTATFNFDGKVGGMVYPSLSSTQQDSFKADLFRELATLKKWSAEKCWLPFPSVDLQIFVSDEYKISRALVPAAIGQRGRMEFPAWKVVAGEAAIAHELVHVYFPNANRLLAEGLAVYLQALIGGNPAFPNFGIPLYDMVRDLLYGMVPEFVYGSPKGLERIRITDLDRIATPSPLRLRVGINLYSDDSAGQARIYPIAGSFVQFLIETHGMDKFRALFLRTPLQPFERDAGSPERWQEIYGTPVKEIEEQWKWKVALHPTIA